MNMLAESRAAHTHSPIFFPCASLLDNLLVNNPMAISLSKKNLMAIYIFLRRDNGISTNKIVKA
jgi:hypothetical protein